MCFLQLYCLGCVRNEVFGLINLLKWIRLFQLTNSRRGTISQIYAVTEKAAYVYFEFPHSKVQVRMFIVSRSPSAASVAFKLNSFNCIGLKLFNNSRAMNVRSISD